MVPSKIQLHKRSKCLELHFGDQAYTLSAEYLRVHSPSAEVKGHGPGQEVLQSGKRDVGITNLEGVGNYALRPSFDDGHDSGIFTWEYLYRLASDQEAMWDAYLAKLHEAHQTRDADTQGVRLMDP